MANLEYTFTKKCIFSDLTKLKVLVGLVDFTSLRTFGHCEPLGLLTYSRLPASIKPPKSLGSPKHFGLCGPHGPSVPHGPSRPFGPSGPSGPSGPHSLYS